jgi:hypothetical protein
MKNQKVNTFHLHFFHDTKHRIMQLMFFHGSNTTPWCHIQYRFFRWTCSQHELLFLLFFNKRSQIKRKQARVDAFSLSLFSIEIINLFREFSTFSQSWRSPVQLKFFSVRHFKMTKKVQSKLTLDWEKKVQVQNDLDWKKVQVQNDLDWKKNGLDWEKKWLDFLSPDFFGLFFLWKLSSVIFFFIE